MRLPFSSGIAHIAPALLHCSGRGSEEVTHLHMEIFRAIAAALLCPAIPIDTPFRRFVALRLVVRLPLVLSGLLAAASPNRGTPSKHTALDVDVKPMKLRVLWLCLGSTQVAPYKRVFVQQREGRDETHRFEFVGLVDRPVPRLRRRSICRLWSGSKGCLPQGGLRRLLGS